MHRHLAIQAVGGLWAFFFSSFLLLTFGQQQAGTIAEPWIDTSNRAAVIVAYNVEFSIDVPDMEWGGSYDGCSPGDSSDSLRAVTIRRVNYYRAMAGVPAGVVENKEFSQKAQHAALAMSAEGRLTHTPESDFACLSDDGVEAAANSNLYLGRTGPRAIDGYIEDPGDRNRDVGHRNTILHPATKEMGVGHVAGSETLLPSNALWVFDERVFEAPPPLREPEGFVAWPPRGFVPDTSVYPRWSFGLTDANFDEATVTMVSQGQSVDLAVVAQRSQLGYVPAPIIVWEPDLVLEDNPTYDRDFDITVDNVIVDGVSRRYTYRVTVLGGSPSPSEGEPDPTSHFGSIRSALGDALQLAHP